MRHCVCLPLAVQEIAFSVTCWLFFKNFGQNQTLTMAGHLDIDDSDVMSSVTSKRVTWTVQKFEQSTDGKWQSADLPFPEPFENLTFYFYASRESLAVVMIGRESLPEPLDIQLRVIGKKSGSFYDLSRPTNCPTAVGGVVFMPLDEFIANWLTEDGSLVVECHIIPKNAKLYQPPLRDQLLTKAFEDGSFADFTLICEGKEIKIVKGIVGPQSDFFRGMFESDMEESKIGQAEITNMAFDTLHLLIKFLYSGKINGHLITRDVLIAADFLNIEGVREFYEQFATRNLHKDTINETLLISQKFNLPQLADKCFEFLSKTNSVVEAYKNLLDLVEPKPI